MYYVLGQIKAGGNTGMAEGLSMAFIELQRAHLAELATNSGNDFKANNIVLFTDGVPNEIAGYLNNPAIPLSNSSVAQYNATNAAYSNSACTWNPSRGSPYPADITGTPNLRMIGSIGDSGGVFQLLGTDATDNTKTKLNSTGNLDYQVDISDYSTALASCGTITVCTANCGGRNQQNTTYTELQSGSNGWDLGALYQIPPTDIYGNSTQGANFVNSTGTSDAGTAIKSINYTGVPNSGDQLQVAAWNAVDNAATTIRTSSLAGYPITIYTIGYTPDGGTDAGLLMRVANDRGAQPAYITTQPIGHYYEANIPADILAAEEAIASQILRLSQ